jgi:hypothetical protein
MQREKIEPFSFLRNNKYYQLWLESEGLVDELVCKRRFVPKRRIQPHDLWTEGGNIKTIMLPTMGNLI